MSARLPHPLTWGISLSLCLLAGLAYGQDIAGSRDHPLVSRYAGSGIIGYDEREFDEYALLTSKATKYGGKEKNLDACRTIEGKVTKITYRAPRERSTLEVFRNYENSLKEANFELLFNCAKEECGGRNFNHAVVPYDLVFGDYYQDQRYLAAKLPRDEGDVYLSLYVVHNRAGGGPGADRVHVQLDVIETRPMEAGMVTIDAEAMAKGIAAEGHVAVYGIYFDIDKSEIKPESKPTLDEIAKLLNASPDLEVLVVGHTDNVGTPQYNLGLSRRRAEAVVRALTSDHGIASSRLTSSGAGLAAPVASNRTEEGRAKNRRVELVER
jgi:outer membrane protein OmpA-like peptidoglycan-associated protein